MANHMRFADAGKMRESTLKRFLRMPNFEEHLELHRLDVLSSNGLLGNYELVKERLEQTPVTELKPAPLLGGDDLMVETGRAKCRAHAADADDRRSHFGHAAENQARQADVPEAEGLRGRQASARGAEARRAEPY